MTTPLERVAVWDAMLESEYQRRYWHSKAAQFSKRERFLQIALAVLSSSAVLSALGEMEQLWLWKVLSALTAIVATVQPFLNYTRLSTKMSDVGAQWHQLEIEYESMWRFIDNNHYSEDNFMVLQNKSVEISNASADLPFDDTALQQSCYNYVLIGRGEKK